MLKRARSEFRFLLVENDPVTVYLLTRCLQEYASFSATVDHAKNIDHALQKISHNSYDILLVDSDLKSETGIDLLNVLNDKHFDILSVLMTPDRNERVIKEAKELGVSDFIVKNENNPLSVISHLEKILEKRGFHISPETKKTDRRGRDMKKAHVQIPRDVSDPSIQDELTGTYTHSYMYDLIANEFSRSMRYRYPMSCLLIDIDHFKVINEEWGHRTGDSLLEECSGLLFDSCRLSDSISRFGGEEFAILMPFTNYKGAAELANRLKTIFEKHRFRTGLGEIHITVSMGIASFPEDSIENGSDLLNFSGQALFRSKASGRNRITNYRDLVSVFGDRLPVLKIKEEKVLEFQRRMTEISDMARRGYIEASKVLIMALENKDRFTAGHSGSCARYALEIAEQLGMSVEDAEVVQHAALLHDIGKICIPDQILLKPAKLTFAEYETMKQHPYLGYKILKPITFLQQEALLVLHHHEWFNGEGYPCRLKGNEIPLGARIISVIDSYDTMCVAGGRYKKTCSPLDAVNELIQCSGVQFDPHAVQALIDVLKKRGELKSEEYDKPHLEEVLQKFPT